MLVLLQEVSSTGQHESRESLCPAGSSTGEEKAGRRLLGATYVEFLLFDIRTVVSRWFVMFKSSSFTYES